MEGLTNLEIPYEINHKLVRGLDYYNNTTFEFITDRLGSQSAILAGGRYDNLMKQMGGSNIPGIGWAAGIERLALLATIKKDQKKKISIIPIGIENNILCIKLANELINKNISIDMGYSGNLKKRLKQANKVSADYAIILGNEEVENNNAIIRNLETGSQDNIKLDKLVKHIEKILL